MSNAASGSNGWGARLSAILLVQKSSGRSGRRDIGSRGASRPCPPAPSDKRGGTGQGQSRPARSRSGRYRPHAAPAAVRGWPCASTAAGRGDPRHRSPVCRRRRTRPRHIEDEGGVAVRQRMAAAVATKWCFPICRAARRWGAPSTRPLGAMEAAAEWRKLYRHHGRACRRHCATIQNKTATVAFGNPTIFELSTSHNLVTRAGGAGEPGRSFVMPPTRFLLPVFTWPPPRRSVAS